MRSRKAEICINLEGRGKLYTRFRVGKLLLHTKLNVYFSLMKKVSKRHIRNYIDRNQYYGFNLTKSQVGWFFKTLMVASQNSILDSSLLESMT